jgi:hypothetical protein
MQMHGKARDLSRFLAFRCRSWVYLDAERREKGKHMVHAIEAINLGFEPNAGCYLLFIPEKNCLMTSNQMKFDEYLFAF